MYVSDDVEIQNFCLDMESLNPKYKEVSAKLKSNSISKNRVLFGFDVNQISYDVAEKILRRYNFPDDNIVELMIKIFESERVLFSIDKENKKSTFKVYVEAFTCDGFKSDNFYESIRGFKWDKRVKSLVETTYYVAIATSLENVLLVAKMCGIQKEEIPSSILNTCNARTQIYYVVDKNTNRKSICIRLEDFFLEDLHDTNLQNKFVDFKSCRIRHFQIGIDKNQEKFATFYFRNGKQKIDI
jgi:hypothetical protein